MKNIYGYIALSLLILFLLVSNFIWLKLNEYPPDWDPSWYLETSVNIYNQTKESGIIGFIDSYTSAFKIKTPLIAVLPLPFYYMFGVNTLTPFLSNFLFTILLNIYFYKLSNLLLQDKFKAILSCIILDTMPIIVWLSRAFFVEYFLITAIVMYMYYLIKSDYFRSTKYNIILGIIGGCGILLKIIFPIYVAGPTLLVLIRRIKIDYYSFRKLLYDISIILLIVLFLSFTWLYKNIINISYFMYNASFGTLAGDYAIEGSYLYQLKTYYTLIINYNISSYYFLLLLVILLVTFINLFIKKYQLGYYKLALLILWLAPIILFSIGKNKEIRFTAPFLPPLAIMISKYISYNGVIKKFGIVLVFLFPFYSVLYSSFTEIPGQDLSFDNFIILKKNTQHLSPPRQEYWPINEIIDFIYQDSNKKQHTFIAILTAIKEFNHNNFRYFNSIKNYQNLDFGGLPRNNFNEALTRLRDAKYIISKTGVEEDYLNKYNNELQHMIDSDKNLYILIKKLRLPDKTYSLIYKKVY